MTNKSTLHQIIELLKTHKKYLQDNFRVKDLAIFGSYARGEEKRDSDLDILVSFDAPVSLLDLTKLENYLDELLRLKTDVVTLEDLRKEIRKKVLEEAIFL